MLSSVNKFGGGIINGVQPVKHLSEIFKNNSSQVSVNVFSAMGKTTNNLESLVKANINRDKQESEKVLNNLLSFHINIALELFPKGHVVFEHIESIFEKIRDTLANEEYFKNPTLLSDQIIPYGEKLATLVVGNYFDYVGIPNKVIDATTFLKTDTNFGFANVDKETTAENLKLEISPSILESNKNIITQGFIGFCDYKFDNQELKLMTTLGREGSDYTAGLLGNILNVDRVILWKDVPGVMEGNPKLAGNENVKKIDSMTYDQLENVLKSTAQGLVHPKTINEVKEKRISLQVRPFWDLNNEGTIIS